MILPNAHVEAHWLTTSALALMGAAMTVDLGLAMLVVVSRWIHGRRRARQVVDAIRRLQVRRIGGAWGVFDGFGFVDGPFESEGEAIMARTRASQYS
jgi:hypothetical protein